MYNRSKRLAILLGLVVLLASCSQTETVAAPTGLTVTPGEGEIVLTWQDNSDNETGFDIYRQNATAALRVQQAGGLERIGSVGANITRYEDKDVKPGVRYRYGVSAQGSGNANASAVVESAGEVAPMPENQAPTASPQTLEVAHETPLTLTLQGSDPDGDSLSYAVVAAPTKGSLSSINQASGAVRYTPNEDAEGEDSFTFTVSDGQETSAPATVTLTIGVGNTAPVANAQEASTDEDTPVTLTLTGSDAEGSALSFAIVTVPTKGSLGAIDQMTGEVTYSPNADETGEDSFTFTVNDGEDTSEPATVTITIGAVNDAPVAEDLTDSTSEDTPLTLTLVGSDTDGDSLSYAVVTAPTKGSLGEINQATGEVEYTPNENETGEDSFTFTVSDGELTSAEATVTITVNAENDAPTGISLDNSSVAENDDPDTVVGTLSATDIDSDNFTFSLVAGNGDTDNASFSIDGDTLKTAASFDYETDAEYSVRVQVDDGEGGTFEQSFTIDVTNANEAPVINEGDDTDDGVIAVTTSEDSPTIIGLNAMDVDAGTELSWRISSDPSNGSASVGVFIGGEDVVFYSPNENYNGPDSFVVEVSDGDLSDSMTVNVTVNPVNDAPVATPLEASTEEDTAVTLTLSGSDIDEGDEITSFAVVTGPSKGSLGDINQATGEVIYTPNENENGADSFTFTVSDGDLESQPATVTINLNVVNDAPEADAQSVSTDEDTVLEITLTASDVDGDDLSYTVVSLPSNGVLTGTAPTLSYTPNLNYNGSDSFTFKVNDGQDDSAVVTVSITINAVNDAPVADAKSVSTDEDNAVNVTLSGSDTESDPLTFAVVDAPANGSVTGTAPDMTYTPDENFNGSDSFTYRANDGSADSETVTVSVTVNAVNDAPVADGQDLSTDEDTALEITLSGSDVEGDSLTYTVVSGPTNGSLSGTAPGLTYTPAADFNGEDSVTFKVNDSSADSATATISITVNAVNDAPTAISLDNASVVENEPAGTVVGTLSGTDVDSDSFTYSLVSGAGDTDNGSFKIVGSDLETTASFDYETKTSYSVRVQTSDGSGTFEQAFTINVTDVDDTAPSVTIGDPGELTEGETVTLSGTASDNVAVSKVEVFEDTTLLGSATLSGGNWSYDYTPATAGSHTLKAVASDAAGNTNEASQAVTVVVGGIVVTSDADSGAGTLRQAIADASTGDTITFASTVETITLSSGQMTIAKNLTIEGGVTIDANNNGRIFFINSGSTFTLKDITLTGGSVLTTVGGTVDNRGNLVLQGTTSITGNEAKQGGAVYVGTGASLTLQDSASISNNTAEQGGGVYSLGTLTLQGNSSVSGNAATVDGGGVYREGGSLIGADYEGNDVGGDGVYNIYDNTPDQVYPDISPPSVTFNNPGELTAGETVTLSGTASDNVGVTKVEIFEGASSKGTAILSGTNWSFSYTAPATAGDYTLKTVASDAAGNTGEATQAVTVVVGGTVTTSADSGAGSLRQAIVDATSGDTITFDDSVTAITLTSGQLVVDKNLTIEGNVTVSGNNSSRVFRILAGVSATIRDLTITGGNGLGEGGFGNNHGGGISVEGDLTLAGSAVVTGNTASSGGGGAYLFVNANLTLKDNASITGNQSGSGGGAFAYENNVITLSDSASITGNTASSNGGGVTLNVSGGNSKLVGADFDDLNDDDNITGNTPDDVYTY